MFPRTILETLRRWAIAPRTKPIVLRGARQVGKTTAVKLLGEEFDQFIMLDLEVPGDAGLFQRGLGIRDLFQAILLSRGLRRSKGRTLLFLDEIQESPEAIASLRHFHDAMPDLHVIAAVSLLEAVLARGDVTFPVGRVRHLFMHPLTFQEFLSALGDDGALEALNTVPCPAVAHPHLLARFHRYTLVGGMPEIVAAFVESRDVTILDRLYSSLLTSYLDDVSKYARNQTLDLVIRHAIEAAPLEAGARIKFAGFGRSNYRSREMGEALRTLERAMLLFLLYPTTSTSLPITPDLRKSPRLQFLDTGLLNFALGLQAQYFEYDDLHAFHRGRLAEHIVGQELLASSSDVHHKPCLWVREKRQSIAEVDFVLQHQNRVIPVEVKAGKSGTLRSLHQFMDRCDHGLAVRLHSGPLGRQQVRTAAGTEFTLLDLPYFLASRIHEHVESMITNRG